VIVGALGQTMRTTVALVSGSINSMLSVSLLLSRREASTTTSCAYVAQTSEAVLKWPMTRDVTGGRYWI
jgi:hypothetical protein